MDVEGPGRSGVRAGAVHVSQFQVEGRIQVFLENAEYPTHWFPKMPAESVLAILGQQIRSAEGKVEHLKKLAAAVEATLPSSDATGGEKA